jgi:GTP cyclohydrolase I
VDETKIASAVKLLLEGLDVEPNPAAIDETSERVAKAWVRDLLKGYAVEPGDVLSKSWTEGGAGIVVMKDIEFTSVCRHHLLPFSGVASVAYLPDGRVTGLSKIADLVDCLSRRLQLQESLTDEIASALMTHLKPKGAACLVRAEHCCVSARGPRKSGAAVVTTSLKGVFYTDSAYRSKFLQLAR